MNAPPISVIPFEKPPFFSSVLHEYRKKVIDNRSRTNYSDEEIIAGLRARDIMIINYVYKQSYPQIRYLVISNSGTKMDAEDLFQDVMIVIYKKISTENLKLTSSFNTYLYAICRHLWLQKLNKHKFNYEYMEIADLDEFQDDHDMEALIEESGKYKLFRQHFLRLSIDDQKVLKLYMSKISLKEIARIMNYKSDKYAKFRKYICKEKLKNSILNDPQFQKISQYDCLAPVFINN